MLAMFILKFKSSKIKLAGTAQLDDVLNLLQLTEITGGHTVDLSGKASTTYVNDLAATLNSRIDAKANHNFVETSLTALQTDFDAKQDAFNVVSPLAWMFDPGNPLDLTLGMSSIPFTKSIDGQNTILSLDNGQ